MREVLNCDLLYVALTNMDFDWVPYPTLVLKKGQDVVGEMVQDEEVIARLSNQKNVWIMGGNFVVNKDKMSFPHDIVKKICQLEIPFLSVDWCTLENDKFQCHSIIFATPATNCDLYLKEQYFSGLDEMGLGTILIGVKL